jgi:hypothetical protein
MEASEYTWAGRDHRREAVPRVPGALLYRPRPERVTPQLEGNSEIFRKFDAVVMAAAVGFEPTDRVFPVTVRPESGDYKSPAINHSATVPCQRADALRRRR